jgi:cytochrome c556
MRKLAIAAAPLLLLALGATPMPEEGDGTLYIRSHMQGPINDATNALWEIGNNAMDDEGGLDPAQLDDARWAELIRAADLLGLASQKMADAPEIRAAFPGHEKDEEPGAYSMEDVQSYFDADPQAFRLMAQALADHSARISAAAKARDAKNAGLLIGEIDQVCETCHAKYWYPEG